MRTILIAFFLLFIADAFGQIDIMETKEKEYSKPPAYDSTYNFGSFKDIMRFSGQIIYLIPISKHISSKRFHRSINLSDIDIDP